MESAALPEGEAERLWDILRAVLLPPHAAPDLPPDLDAPSIHAAFQTIIDRLRLIDIDPREPWLAGALWDAPGRPPQAMPMEEVRAGTEDCR